MKQETPPEIVLGLSNRVVVTSWWSHFQSWRTSGLSAKEFCQREDIPYRAFGRWKRKFLKALPDRAAYAPTVPDDAISMIPVRVIESETQPAAFAEPSAVQEPASFEIVLPSELRLRVPPDFDPDSLRRLIQTLEDL